MIKDKQSGFTIIELLVATTVFSLILVVALAGVLRVTQLYYKGITAARTQEVSRTLLDEISESIKFSNSIISLPDNPVTGPVIDADETDDTSYFCIGSRRYTYAIDRMLSSDNPDENVKEKRHVLWVDVPDRCDGPADLSIEEPSIESFKGRELLGENMRLARLQVIPDNLLGREAYTINISIAYGDHAEANVVGGEEYGGALAVTPDGNSRTCQSLNSPFVGQFCHVSSTSVLVERRLQ